MSGASEALGWSVYALWLSAPAVAVVLYQKRILHPAAFRAGAGLGRRDAAALPLGVWFLGAVTMFLAVPVAAGQALALPDTLLGPVDSLRRAATVEGVGYGFAAAAGALLLWLLGPRAGATAGLRLRGSDAVRGAAAFLLIAPIYFVAAAVSSAAARYATGAPSDAVAHSTLSQMLESRSDPWLAARIATVVLGAPIAEELLYRGFLQSGLVSLFRGGGRTWVAIGLTSALFAVAHAVSGGPVPWHAVPPLFVLSVGLGIVHEQAAAAGGGVLAPITAHACFNAANIALALLVIGSADAGPA